MKAAEETPMGSKRLAFRPLPRRFYSRGAEQVARELLGCLLIRRVGKEVLAGRIVETEAYVGEEDQACHARHGMTARNAVMYGEPGHAYVYFIYGVHDMLNVVCQARGRPEAVLLRALEPVQGLNHMRRMRGVQAATALASGPGKLCQAMGVTRRENGIDLCGDALWIVAGRLAAGESVRRSPRIGVHYAGRDALRLRRYYVDGNPHVSSSSAARERRRKLQSRKTPAAKARRRASS
jgi:DNA-3-methyladenine glycosylase